MRALVPGRLLGFALAGLLALPLFGLLFTPSLADLAAGARHPLFTAALGLSLETTLASLLIVVVTGTPLAWWLVTTRARAAAALEVLVDLPIVIPPSVVGVALLQTFGRQGLLGPSLDALGISVPFTPAAVVIAQVVVSAPFYVQAAANAFRKVELDLLIVARTLGAGPARAFFAVAVPVALPGLLAGASLAWARALGEFGATLLFAGNLTGTTQTMPLAIYTALEQDVRVALVFALVLAALGAFLLVGLRATPWLFARLARGSR